MTHLLYDDLVTRAATGEAMPFRDGCRWALLVFTPGQHYREPKDERFNRRVRVGLDIVNHAGLHRPPLESLTAQRRQQVAELDRLDSNSLVARTGSHRLVRAMLHTGLELHHPDDGHVEGILYAEWERNRFAAKTGLKRGRADHALQLLEQQVGMLAKPGRDETLWSVFRACGIDSTAIGRPVARILETPELVLMR